MFLGLDTKIRRFYDFTHRISVKITSYLCVFKKVY